MTMFFEPTTIEPDSSAVAEKEDGLQYIHSRIIRNESGLCKLLAERYGRNFEIELRHNVYRIKIPSGSKALNLDDLDKRSILRFTTREKLDPVSADATR